MVYHDIEADADWACIKLGECPECGFDLKTSFIPNADGSETASYYCPACGWDESVWHQEVKKRSRRANEELHHLGYF